MGLACKCFALWQDDGNVVAGYWGAQGLVSRWVATTNGPQSQFYQYDARGCAAAVLDASGNVLGIAAYTAWGANYGTEGLPGPVGYAGRFGERYRPYPHGQPVLCPSVGSVHQSGRRRLCRYPIPPRWASG